jgi:ABC-type antimicrobial peptide transport system permease subunit
MEEVVTASPGISVRRLLAATFLGFAVLAVVLSGIGLFGVVAHDVATRRVELALRLALGASPRRLLMRILGQGVRMVGTGLVLGGLLSVWTTEALSGLVFATHRFDPFNIAVVGTMLMVVGAIAVLPAARRASQLDPASALKAE